MQIFHSDLSSQLDPFRSAINRVGRSKYAIQYPRGLVRSHQIRKDRMKLKVFTFLVYVLFFAIINLISCLEYSNFVQWLEWKQKAHMKSDTPLSSSSKTNCAPVTKETKSKMKTADMLNIAFTILFFYYLTMIVLSLILKKPNIVLWACINRSSRQFSLKF